MESLQGNYKIHQSKYNFLFFYCWKICEAKNLWTVMVRTYGRCHPKIAWRRGKTTRIPLWCIDQKLKISIAWFWKDPKAFRFSSQKIYAYIQMQNTSASLQIKNSIFEMGQKVWQPISFETLKVQEKSKKKKIHGN